MVNFSYSSIKSFSDLVAKNLFQSIINTTQTSSQFCDLNSTIRIKAKGDIIIDGGVKVQAKGYCHMKAMFSSSNTTDLKTQIDSSITKALSQDSQQESSVLGFLQVNAGMQKQESESYIKNIISKQITESVLQQAIQKSDVSSDLSLETDGSVKITGGIGVDIQSQILSETVAQNVASILQNDSIFQQIDEKEEQKNRQKEEQLSSVIFYAIIAVVVALLGIFVLPQLLFGGSKNEKEKKSPEVTNANTSGSAI